MMKSSVQMSGVVCSALKGCMQPLEVSRELLRPATSSIYIGRSIYTVEDAGAPTKISKNSDYDQIFTIFAPIR
jgi:hypothetical protein